MMSSKKTLQNALSLSQFMRRQKVLGLYRQFFRITRKLDSDQQKQEMRQWIRSEFQSKSTTQDKELIEMHLSHGQNALRDLEVSLRHAHALKD